LNLPFVVEPLTEFVKTFFKGFLIAVSVVSDLLIKQGLKQSLDPPILPQLALVNAVVKRFWTFKQSSKTFDTNCPPISVYSMRGFLCQKNGLDDGSKFYCSKKLMKRNNI